MSNSKYQVFCDLDGVLINFVGGVPVELNSFIGRVVNKRNLYKTRWPKLYSGAKKTIAEMGGDLDTQDPGQPIVFEDCVKESDKKQPRRLMYQLISNNRKWWAELDWLPDGKELWEYILKYNPSVATGPMGLNSKLGKRDWCNRELNLGKDKVIITHTKHEEIRKVLKRGLIPLLIDDMPKYVIPWRNAGGIAIHHSNTKQTIEKLKSLGL